MARAFWQVDHRRRCEKLGRQPVASSIFVRFYGAASLRFAAHPARCAGCGWCSGDTRLFKAHGGECLAGGTAARHGAHLRTRQEECVPHITIDLKTGGTRPYVDAIRVLGFANGIAETGTAARMRALGVKAGFSGEDVQAAIDGFHFLQLLRLRNQQHQ